MLWSVSMTDRGRKNEEDKLIVINNIISYISNKNISLVFVICHFKRKTASDHKHVINILI